ncbi:DEKNAAC100119 [Brettanomyces naardenensis]|uniref:DEKNAAC100119 n=1 Tax=Brettanomyces naardenensis TaxID=13370 RepID=A0A448YFI2_BRENA|nr:DEKNAAC100119 [Brettanomyces naardenensis]
MSAILRQSARSLLRTSCRRGYMIPASSIVARYNSTAAPTEATKEVPEAKGEAVDAKIQQIVESISQLTLLETSALIKELKSKLDIPDVAFPVAGAAVAAPSAVDADAADAGAKEEPKQKTIFNLKLESFDAKSKAKVIKEVKSELGLSLVAAKKLVESAPKVLKENMSKEDAEKFKETLEKHGAKVTLE